MMAVAPNLTVLVGELVGARLIAHAGKSSERHSFSINLNRLRLTTQSGQTSVVDRADPRCREGSFPRNENET
jgi:hypothetical protein